MPDAEEGLSYGVPVVRLGGKNVAGFSGCRAPRELPATQRHRHRRPRPGGIEGFEASKGAIRMPVDTPLPDDLVAELIAARRGEAGV